MTSQNIESALQIFIAQMAKQQNLFNTMERIEIDNVLRAFEVNASNAVDLAVELAQYIDDSFHPVQDFRDKEAKALRVPKDADNKSIQTGDSLHCINDDEDGDSGEGFDLVKGNIYKVAGIHDDKNLSAPMLILADSKSGPVSGERFRIF